MINFRCLKDCRRKSSKLKPRDLRQCLKMEKIFRVNIKLNQVVISKELCKFLNNMKNEIVIYLK